MFDVTEANEYFETHLKCTFWNSLDLQTRTAAVTQAVRDISCHLGVSALDESDIFIYCAVFEQAVYLAEYFDELNSPRQMQSETIDGVGSHTYNAPVGNAGGRPSRLAPGAAEYLARYVPVNRVRRG
ncbi:MAG: hypothetical protein PHI85_02325 [Victivallaceae bacterium]|nr:hypothetical protein [Victivallaceae bacterium]